MMEEVIDETQTKPEIKEEYIPLDEEGIPLGSITNTKEVKKDDEGFTDTPVKTTKEEQSSGNFETKSAILFSLVKNCGGLKVKNEQDDDKKTSLIEGGIGVKTDNEESITCHAESSNTADSEKTIEDVLVEIVESDDPGFLEGKHWSAGKTNYSWNFETGNFSMDHGDNSLDDNNQCNDCGETFPCNDSLLEHAQKVHAKPQVQKHCCKTCGMEFKYRANCRKHEKLHNDEFRFKCKYCNISFKQSLTLKNHYIYVHETEKPYKCEECTSSFKSMNNLKAHIEVHHNLTGEKFSCDFCHMEFKRRCYLKRHIGVHTNPDKKFTCDDCGLKCRSKTDIAKHVLTHIGAVEKRFACEICGVGFSKQAHVVRHRRTHSVEKSFPCELCDKAYKDQYSLRTHHETVHLGITFSCELCGFQSDRHSLKKHLRRCVAQKKFICEICKKEYYLKKWFELHVKGHSIQN